MNEWMNERKHKRELNEKEKNEFVAVTPFNTDEFASVKINFSHSNGGKRANETASQKKETIFFADFYIFELVSPNFCSFSFGFRRRKTNLNEMEFPLCRCKAFIYWRNRILE